MAQAPKSKSQSSREVLVFQDFEGGWSVDGKVGIANSQPYTQAMDFRKSPSQMSVLPGPTREDNGVVKDLAVNEVMGPDGSIYAYGNAGYLYKRTTAGVWSVEGNTGTGYFGMDYRKDTDSIYLAGAKSVSSYSPVSTSPTTLVNAYNISFSTYDNSANAGFNVSAYQTGSQMTTTVAVATSPLNEGSNSIRYFQIDIEPLMKASFFIINKGSGNWTATLHDGLNNVLGTATVANANLVNDTFNDFVFSSAPNGQVRLYVNTPTASNGRTYHLHLTSTVADGTVSSTAMNDLSTCDIELWADRLVQTNNGMHPMVRFQQYETFGNGNYLSIWEPITNPPTNAEWQRHALIFPMEYEMCGLAATNEFIVMGLEKDTTGTSTPQEGLIAYWDGTSSTYNYYFKVPEGSPYGISEYKNTIYYYAGGARWAVTPPSTNPTKIWTMPGSDTEFSGANAPVIVYPYTSTVRRGIHLFGYPSTTTNTNIDFGVYSWGSVDKNFPESFGYNYLISTGNQNYSGSNNLQIGMVKSFGDILHTSWRDDLNGGYGIDVVTNASKPVPYATWNSLIIDDGWTRHLKTANYMDVYYYIPSGCTVTLKYQIDRSGTWVSSQAYSTTNLWEQRPNLARFNMSDSGGGTFHEIQLGIDVTCDSTVTTAPIIRMVSFVYDPASVEL